jgi:hypothetical protein
MNNAFDMWWKTDFKRIIDNNLSPAKEAWDHQQKHIDAMSIAVEALQDKIGELKHALNEAKNGRLPT